MTKPPDEKKIRQKIMQALRHKIQGLPNELRQPEINKIVGKTSVRAPFLKALLETMQKEELIDCHWRQWRSKEQRGGDYWSLWDHPDNIKARAWREKHKKESEEIHRIIEKRQRQWQIENAPRLARERFQRDLSELLVDNYDEIFELFECIYRTYTRKPDWKSSWHSLAHDLPR